MKINLYTYNVIKHYAWSYGLFVNSKETFKS